MGIVVFGAVFVDIKGYPDSKFIPGGRNVGRVIQIHGGVSRNVVEDMANVGLHPVFVSAVDGNSIGQDVVNHLREHNVRTDYIIRRPDSMGTWLAVFSHCGDVIASISKRPDLSPLLDVLENEGDSLIADADSIVVEMDMETDILNKIFALAEKYGKKVYAVVSNMGIAMERRELLRKTACIVCNKQEAGMLFSENYDDRSADEMVGILKDRLERSGIPCMVVTLGEEGAVYAESGGIPGYCPSTKVDVIDTTGAGDAFFAGVAMGLTYGKNLEDSCRIGVRLACSVIMTRESVCPRFLPCEFGLPDPSHE